MTLFDTVKLSFTMLRTNKVRSFLTSLGIIIGIAAVIVIISVGAGAQSLIISQLNAVGSNLIGVLPGKSDDNGPPASAFGIVVTTLTIDDARAIKKEVPNVTAVTTYNTGAGTITYGNRDTSATYYGVMADYPKVEEAAVMTGRFFTAEEEDTAPRVAVLGYEVWRELFDNEDPVGKKVRIKKDFFEVIGVMEQRGFSGFQNSDTIVLVPASTAQKVMLGVDYVNFLRAKVNTTDNLSRAENDIELLLRDRHNIGIGEDSDFSVRNLADAILTLTAITDALKFFLAAIAGISLVVGGVGVMNIMLASVNERIREVGLRLAVGARKYHIMRQFVFETMAITLAGGVIGVALGTGVSYIVAVVAGVMGYKWEFVVTPGSIMLGVGTALIVGLVFGLYPARRAARLDLIVALRYE